MNDKYRLYTKVGLFSETLVGQERDKPLYRYELTDKGRQYVNWRLGSTNFCFGHIVVDSIDRVQDVTNGVGGAKIRIVHFNYHLENIPDWIKDESIYSLDKGYGAMPKAVKGEIVKAIHQYRV